MVKEKGITCFFINIFNTFVMNWNELNELGSELLNDLEEAFSDYDFIDVEEDGIYTESDSEAMYQVSISWDYGEMDDVDDDDIEEVLDNVISDWDDYEVTYDWDGSTILVALHIDDYEGDDD